MVPGRFTSHRDGIKALRGGRQGPVTGSWLSIARVSASGEIGYQ